MDTSVFAYHTCMCEGYALNQYCIDPLSHTYPLYSLQGGSLAPSASTTSSPSQPVAAATALASRVSTMLSQVPALLEMASQLGDMLPPLQQQQHQQHAGSQQPFQEPSSSRWSSTSSGARTTVTTQGDAIADHSASASTNVSHGGAITILITAAAGGDEDAATAHDIVQQLTTAVAVAAAGEGSDVVRRTSDRPLKSSSSEASDGLIASSKSSSVPSNSPSEGSTYGQPDSVSRRTTALSLHSVSTFNPSSEPSPRDAILTPRALHPHPHPVVSKLKPHGEEDDRSREYELEHSMSSAAILATLHASLAQYGGGSSSGGSAGGGGDGSFSSGSGSSLHALSLGPLRDSELAYLAAGAADELEARLRTQQRPNLDTTLPAAIPTVTHNKLEELQCDAEHVTARATESGAAKVVYSVRASLALFSTDVAEETSGESSPGRRISPVGLGPLQDSDLDFLEAGSSEPDLEQQPDITETSAPVPTTPVKQVSLYTVSSLRNQQLTGGLLDGKSDSFDLDSPELDSIMQSEAAAMAQLLLSPIPIRPVSMYDSPPQACTTSLATSAGYSRQASIAAATLRDTQPGSQVTQPAESESFRKAAAAMRSIIPVSGIPSSPLRPPSPHSRIPTASTTQGLVSVVSQSSIRLTSSTSLPLPDPSEGSTDTAMDAALLQTDEEDLQQQQQQQQQVISLASTEVTAERIPSGIVAAARMRFESQSSATTTTVTTPSGMVVPRRPSSANSMSVNPYPTLGSSGGSGSFVLRDADRRAQSGGGSSPSASTPGGPSSQASPIKKQLSLRTTRTQYSPASAYQDSYKPQAKPATRQVSVLTRGPGSVMTVQAATAAASPASLWAQRVNSGSMPAATEDGLSSGSASSFGPE